MNMKIDAAAISIIIISMVLGWAMFPKSAAPSAQHFVQADGGYNNQTKWQDANDAKQAGCVARIIEIAPPSATREELDYNLHQCLLQNDVFI